MSKAEALRALNMEVGGQALRCYRGCTKITGGMTMAEVASEPLDHPVAEAPVEPTAEQLAEFRETHPPIKGGAVVTAVAAGGVWSAGATWDSGVQPTAADDIVLASTSGNVVVDTATCVCRSLDCQGSGNYAGTFSISSSTNILAIGTSTVNASNIALRFSPTMTFTPFTTAAGLRFGSSSATQVTVTTAGRPMGSVIFGSGLVVGSYLLTDTWTSTSVGANFTHQAGTLNTGGQSITTGTITMSASNAKTWTSGNSTITLTSGSSNVFNIASTTVFTANTATYNVTANVPTVVPAGVNLNGSSFNFTGTGTVTMGGATGINTLTRNGTALKTDGITFTGNVSATSMNFNGNSLALVNRLLVAASPVGTAITLTAGSVTLSNADFRDITGAGAATWSGTSLADGQGNTNITFDTPVTRYAVLTAGRNFSGNAGWSTTSGGATGASSPLLQDTVIFDANTGTGGAMTIDVPRPCRDIICTGWSGTLNAASVSFEIHGNVTWSTGMTLSINASFSMTLRGRGSLTYTSSGKASPPTTVACPPSATYTFPDAYVSNTSSGNALLVTLGTATFQSDVSITAVGNGSKFNMTGGVVNMGNGNWHTGTASSTGGTKFQVSAGTLNAQGSTLYMDDVSATATALITNSLSSRVTLNNVVIAGSATALACQFQASNTSGGFIFAGTLTINAPRTVQFFSGATYTFNGSPAITVNGSSGVTINSTTAGTAANFTKASGIVAINNATLQDNAASGGAAFYAGANSVQGTNVTGWSFTNPAATKMLLTGVGS